jgi:hypothetical protein
MTAIALEAQSFLTKILESIYDSLKSFGKAIVIARQLQANYEVAKMLQREYPNESFDYVFKMVQACSIEGLTK